MQVQPSVSVIVPVYNAGANLPRVLAALRALDPAPAEFVIVDDGSTDSSRAIALAEGLPVWDSAAPQSGPAVARNLGAARAHGDILFFMDSDVVVRPDALVHIHRAFAAPAVAAIFGSYDDAPDDTGFISRYKNLQHHYIHQSSTPEATSFWAGCGAIRREVFNAHGGFSTAYTRPSIEDIELGYRLVAAGASIRLVKALQVKHLKRWTFRSLLVTDIRDRALPWAELLVRRSALPADLNLQLMHRLSAGLSWLLILSLVGLFLSPLFGYAALILIVSLFALNLNFYRFLARKRGILFMLGAIPLHWLYYLYSSGAYAYVLLRNALPSRGRNAVRPTTSNPRL